jgi:hypothetical protein
MPMLSGPHRHLFRRWELAVVIQRQGRDQGFGSGETRTGVPKSVKSHLPSPLLTSFVNLLPKALVIICGPGALRTDNAAEDCKLGVKRIHVEEVVKCHQGNLGRLELCRLAWIHPLLRLACPVVE